MVQVPPGMHPGMTFHANINGQLVAVQVPMGVGPGANLQIQVQVQQQAPRPQQQMARQPTMSMNEEMEIKRKQEDARKERLKEMEEAKREQNSALAQIERHQEERNQPPAAAAPRYHQQRGLGGASAQPGEISALCECLAVECPRSRARHPPRLTDAHLSPHVTGWLNMGL